MNSEGAMVQMGKPKPAGIAVSSLLYNEFIVYSLDQVRIKYLVQLVCDSFSLSFHPFIQHHNNVLLLLQQDFHFKPSAF